MSKTDSYWERRKAKLIHQQMDKAEIQTDEIAKLYDQAKADLMRQADKIFDKFRRDYGLSETQARQILKQVKDPSKLAELRKVLEASPQDDNIQLLLADLDSSAYAARIRRLEELQAQVSAMGDQLAQQEINSATGFYKSFVEDSYYRNMFELQAQAGVGFGFDLLSETQIKAAINSKWLGDNYSSRIWNNVTGLARSLQSELLVSLLTGKTEREMAEALAERFAVGQHQARRLVRTESAYFFNEMDARAMEDADIELYRLVAVLDLKTSKICQQKDGQVHQLKDRQNGVNYPPFHPWCRTGAISNFDAEWLKTAKRWSRDADGKVHYVPADMTYPEWYDEYVDNQSLVGFTNGKEDMKRLYRNKDRNKRRPINITRQNRLTERFRKRGGIIHQSAQGDEYLKKQGAAAINYDANTILLHTKPTVSEVLEELYHAEQWRDGRLQDNPVSKIKAEIEAQKYLLSVEKRYNIPRNESEQTRQNLKYWEGELKKYDS